ncbi:MAG: hypothetical protein KDM91_10855 [Verrucomicrobiae bacterium]|nr:hypothetical protein [Verrucomicrobiae bacterium]MCP5541637.1 hypothetical protein [Akkermansiaceae bacterium]
MNSRFHPRRLPAILALPSLLAIPFLAAAGEPIALGDRLELFADDFLIEEKADGVSFHLHRPEPRDVVLTADASWEGNTSGYYTIFQDGDRIRMIYRGWRHDPNNPGKTLHRETTCYAESADGLRFEKPKLGLFEWEGSKDNNIVWNGAGGHNFTAFRDDNPDCAADARYKAIGSGGGVGKGLFYFKSPDGVRWTQVRSEPIITDGAFDSQNLAFWDGARGEYRAYWRIFTNKVRAIRTATSKDFLTWENQADLTYPEGTPAQHLYTNAIRPYFRAPHVYLGFPTRYLPDEGQRVEPIFMISRDGVEFLRYNEPVIPEDAPEDRRGNRSNYMTWGMVQLPGKPDEISVYATEAYYGPVPGRVRRFVYRLDGFVSLRAAGEPGEVLTKAVAYRGNHLTLNYAAREGGSVSVELLDPKGATLAKSEPLTGDSVKATVKWDNGEPIAAQAGKPVHLRFTLQNADLYSMRFH